MTVLEAVVVSAVRPQYLPQRRQQRRAAYSLLQVLIDLDVVSAWGPVSGPLKTGSELCHGLVVSSKLNRYSEKIVEKQSRRCWTKTHVWLQRAIYRLAQISYRSKPKTRRRISSAVSRKKRHAAFFRKLVK